MREIMKLHPTDQTRPMGGEMTKSSIGRFTGVVSRLLDSAPKLRATGRFLRQQIWAWPIVAAVLFGGAGWWVHQSLEDAMRQQRATDLNTMADASVTALRVWMGEQRINALLLAEDERLAPLAAELAKISDGSPKTERPLLLAKSQDLLRSYLQPKIDICGYVGFFIVSPQGVVLAAEQDTAIGKTLVGYRREVFDKAIAGDSAVSKPFPSILLLPDANGQMRANLPAMYAAAPIHDRTGRPIAALGLRIRPEGQFTRILQVVRFGQSGETYAFDRNGLMLSQSRFDEQMKHLGLLADQPEARSILTVEIRDPQVNMTAGERPTLRRAEQPLTVPVADAVQGKSGCDADGYRDYRGVPSVSACAGSTNTISVWRPRWMLRRPFAPSTSFAGRSGF